MPEHFELEAKYECTAAGCQSLRKINSLDGFTLRMVTTFRQVDTYYDSSGLDLRKQAASIRRRVAGKRITLTYKGPRQLEGRDAHVVRRREEEWRLDGTELADWDPGQRLDCSLMPEPLRIVAKLVDINLLVPIAEVATVREKRIFTAPDCHAVEIAIDHSTGMRKSDGRTVRFDEIEVEAENVDEAMFNSFLVQLDCVIPGLQPGGPSKLNRTLT